MQHHKLLFVVETVFAYVMGWTSSFIRMLFIATSCSA